MPPRPLVAPEPYSGSSRPATPCARPRRPAAGGVQLARIFGSLAGVPVAYHELEPLTSVPGDEEPPAHVPHWAGAETSASEWGRLNGAGEAGRWVAAPAASGLARGGYYPQVSGLIQKLRPVCVRGQTDFFPKEPGEIGRVFKT